MISKRKYNEEKNCALILSAVLLISAFAMPAAAADEEKKLTFGEDGKFRILQINDFQDRGETNETSLEFLNAVLDKYEPDLVVLVGDQLSVNSTAEEPEKECDCNCHKSGFMGFICKIIRFFSKLFGVNKVCDCGKAHY